jgi:FKBP-type peptidyl-prolyl cis-trans isomerase (trigger factor)
VSIKGFVPAAYFSVDLFKHHFNLKDSKEALTKLIEVFSLRHDLSMRRELLEAVLRQLAKQYFFSIPSYVVDQQSNGILHSIQGNPDYHVYKGQSDFEEQIKKLAIKQLKESIIIDALGYQEKISVSDKDVHSYLNLTVRPRTRDFVYFTLPSFKIQGQEAPVPVEIVKQHCKREKTLNHIINTLAKKARA